MYQVAHLQDNIPFVNDISDDNADYVVDGPDVQRESELHHGRTLQENSWDDEVDDVDDDPDYDVTSESKRGGYNMKPCINWRNAFTSMRASEGEVCPPCPSSTPLEIAKACWAKDDLIPESVYRLPDRNMLSKFLTESYKGNNIVLIGKLIELVECPYYH